MPAFVKHEASWEKAKSIVKKQYPNKKGTDFWRLVTTLYKNMEPQDIKKKANCFNALQKISANLNKRADWLDDIRAKQKARMEEFSSAFDNKQEATSTDTSTSTPATISTKQTAEPKSYETRYDNISGLQIPVLPNGKPSLVGNTWYDGDTIIGTADDKGSFVSTHPVVSVQPAEAPSVTEKTQDTAVVGPIATNTDTLPTAGASDLSEDGLYYGGAADTYSLRHKGRTYNYNSNNIAINRNLNKNKKAIDTAVANGQMPVDDLINMAAGDSTYAQRRDAHYNRIPQADKDRVFRYPGAHAINTDKLNISFGPNPYTASYNLESNKASIDPSEVSMPTMVIGSKHPVIPDNSTLADFGVGPSAQFTATDSIAPYKSLLHEGIHGRHAMPNVATSNKTLISADADNSNAVPYNVTATEGNTYAYNPVEQAQAISANSMALDATKRMFMEDPSTAQQFDPAKVAKFMELEAMAPTRESLKTRLDFLLENPEFAYQLGPEAARVLPIYQELQKPGNEALLEEFLSKYFLANNTNTYNNRIVYT